MNIHFFLFELGLEFPLEFPLKCFVFYVKLTKGFISLESTNLFKIIFF